MMRHIRPYEIFTLISPQTATLYIPIRRSLDAGSPTLLETFLLVAAGRLIDAREIFEFGTCRGATALSLAMNFPDATITTLDLGEVRKGEHPDDIPYTERHLAFMPDFAGKPEAERITQIKGDSRMVDYSPWRSKMDLIFIDGGHDRETVESDTRNAFQMVRGGGCIAWHDYRGWLEVHNDITEFMENLARGYDIVHVEDTTLCLWFEGRTLCTTR